MWYLIVLIPDICLFLTLVADTEPFDSIVDLEWLKLLIEVLASNDSYCHLIVELISS